MNLRDALRNERILGTFVSMGDPVVVEILGRVGFELVCIDTEHGAFDAVGIENLIRTADSVNIPAIVRVSGVGPEIGRALDSGAAGVLVPRIESADDTRAVVAAVRYPPTGSRGAGTGRATAYGLDFAAYLGRADGEVAAMVQVETVAGLENVDSIAAVEGLDLVFVGPGDLAVSMGVSFGSPEHSAAIERIASATRAANVPLGIFGMTAESVGMWAERGVTFFLLSGDLGMLAASGKALATEGRANVLSEVKA